MSFTYCLVFPLKKQLISECLTITSYLELLDWGFLKGVKIVVLLALQQTVLELQQ